MMLVFLCDCCSLNCLSGSPVWPSHESSLLLLIHPSLLSKSLCWNIKFLGQSRYGDSIFLVEDESYSFRDSSLGFLVNLATMWWSCGIWKMIVYGRFVSNWALTLACL